MKDLRRLSPVKKLARKEARKWIASHGKNKSAGVKELAKLLGITPTSVWNWTSETRKGAMRTPLARKVLLSINPQALAELEKAQEAALAKKNGKAPAVKIHIKRSGVFTAAVTTTDRLLAQIIILLSQIVDRLPAPPFKEVKVKEEPKQSGAIDAEPSDVGPARPMVTP